MKLNKQFCITACKILSRCATPDKFEYLKECDYTLGESVLKHAAALKEMVVTHTKLITTGEYDNNQLLRFNSVANRLLGEFRNGKISRLSNLTKITKQNKDNTMGLFNKLASLFSTPVQAPQTAFEIAQAKTAEYQAQLDTEKADKLRLAKETEEMRKEQKRFEVAVKQAKATAEAYAITKKEVEAMKLNLEKVSENYNQVVCTGLDFLNNLDNYVADLLMDNSTVANIMKEEKETKPKSTFDALNNKPEVIKPIPAPVIKSTPVVAEEPDDIWAEENVVEETEPEVTAEPKVIKPSANIGAARLRSRRPQLTEADQANIHVEGSTLKDATDVEEIFS